MVFRMRYKTPIYVFTYYYINYFLYFLIFCKYHDYYYCIIIIIIFNIITGIDIIISILIFYVYHNILLWGWGVCPNLGKGIVPLLIQAIPFFF